MMSTGAITLKDKPGRGRRKSCAAGNREIRRGAAENRTIGSGENKKSGGEDKITILSAVRASIP